MTPTDLAGPAVPPTGPASATDVLDGAAALLRQGWVRGEFLRIVGGVRCYCLSAALRAAGGGEHDLDDPYVEVPDDLSWLQADIAVRDELRARGEPDLFDFNDERAESVDDVLAVIEAAKARLS